MKSEKTSHTRLGVLTNVILSVSIHAAKCYKICAIRAGSRTHHHNIA